MPGHLVSNADAKTHSRFFLFGFVLIIMSCILNACGSSSSNHDDTKSMAAIMDSVRQKHFHHQNIFNSEAKLAHADSL